MSDSLFYIGVTHATAELSVRERLRCDDGARWAMLEELADLAVERMVVSTCERFEVYAYGGKKSPDAYIARIADWFDCEAETIASQASVLWNDDAARQMMRVASGLESRIIGEPQILGQVRRAFLEAAECTALGPVLHALGRAAIHTGKRVRRETNINCTLRSSATIAVDRVSGELGGLESKTVVVLGSGRLAADVVANLAVRHVGRILVVGRHLDRAVELAAKVGGVGFTIHGLVEVTRIADAVIACASSPTYLMDAATLGSRTQHRLSIVDLGVPRNVDPSIVSLRGVTLTHLDDLLDAESHRRIGQEQCDAIVQREFQRFLEWQRGRAAAPTIIGWLRALDGEAAEPALNRRRELHFRIQLLKESLAA